MLISIFNCPECGIVFKFQSRLTTHKKVHKRSLDQTCKKGSKVFLRKYYFDVHLKYCIGYNDEFDSSSERPYFLVASLVIDPPGQPIFEPSTDSPEDQNEIDLEEPVNQFVNQFAESSPISLSNPRNDSLIKKY